MRDKDPPHRGQKQTLFLPPGARSLRRVVQRERRTAVPSELNDLMVGTCGQAARERMYVPTCTGKFGKSKPPTDQSGSLALYTCRYYMNSWR